MDTKKEDTNARTAPEAPEMPVPGEPAPGPSAVPSVPLHGPVDVVDDSLEGLQSAFKALSVEEVDTNPVKRKTERKKDAGESMADEGVDHGHDPTSESAFEGAPSASGLHASPPPTTTTLPTPYRAAATSTPITNPPMAEGTGFTGMPSYPAYGVDPSTTAFPEATTASEPVASSSAPRWYAADYHHPLPATGAYVDVPGYATLSWLRRGPESCGGRNRGSGRSANRSLTRWEINEALRGATSRIVGDLTQEIRAKLEPLIPPQVSPNVLGVSPHRVQANHLVAGLTNTLGSLRSRPMPTPAVIPRSPFIPRTAQPPYSHVGISTRAELDWLGLTHKHTHTPTPQPGVAGHSRSPSRSTHTRTAHSSQEWRGASGARTQADTNPDTPAGSGGAQPKPELNHTHPHRTSQPGVAGYKRRAHTSAHTPGHPSQEWRGAAETRAQTHTPTPHDPAGSGGVQGERAHQHTQTPKPQPGVAGRNQNRSPSTHTHAAHPSQQWRGTRGARTQTCTPQHPSQEWGGAAKTRAQTHTPTPHTPARSGGVQAERAQEHTHTPKPQPGVAGRSRNQNASTHTNAAHPSQEWRGTRGARTPTRTPQHPSQEWRGAAETPAQTHTPTPHNPARSGGVQAEHAHQHTHTPPPQPRVAGYKRSAHTNTHTTQPPSQE